MKTAAMDSTIQNILSQIEQATGDKFHVSSLALPIEVTSFNGGMVKIEGFYAFSAKSRGLRFEFIGEDLSGIAVWASPGDLEKPDYRVSDLSQIDFIIEMLSGNTAEVRETIENLKKNPKLQEAARDIVFKFLDSLKDIEGKKVSQLYKDFFMWADKKGVDPVSTARFRGLYNEWLAGKSGGQPMSVITKKEDVETPVMSKEDQAAFDDIMENEVLYTANMMENTIRRIAHKDPGIAAIFLCGGPGLGKTFTVKKILKEEGVWDSDVVYRSGSIAGFTGLLQLLWDYRKDRIVVLDDNDSILAEPKATNILKAALNSDPDARLISYTKLRK